MAKTKHQASKEVAASGLYWQQAKQFVAKNSDDPKDPNWFAITREMTKHIEAWENYFRWRIGFVTNGLNMLLAQKIETFLTPTEWPEWFDTSYPARRAA